MVADYGDFVPTADPRERSRGVALSGHCPIGTPLPDWSPKPGLPCGPTTQPKVKSRVTVSLANNVSYRAGNHLAKAFNQGKQCEPPFASRDTRLTVVDPVEFGQHDFRCVWHDVDGFLVIVPGFSVQALLKKKRGRQLFWCPQKLSFL